MEDHTARRAAARPRTVSAGAAEFGANVSLQDGEVISTDGDPAREASPGRLSAAFGRMERVNSVPQGFHKRHMPMEPLKLTIPRKTKEKRGLVSHVSAESREYEDMMTILTSSYLDTSSTGGFTYSQPRLVNNEQLEKEFVEKRKEMKSDGRTDKELEESYCFLLSDPGKLHSLCEKGLFVGQSWITVLGNPSKGVYLSRYSDLLQINPMTPGATGEILIFKVMKGKVKSIYENMKNLLDPTPRFDSHISKNASKVTSLTSRRAHELTQQYFYEYSFDELRQRPRQVCPFAVVSFQFKGKDCPLPSKPLAPIRLNSQSAEGSKECTQFTVWSGDLVKGDRVLSQISLCSSSPPFLPHKLPEKLEMGWLMKLDQVTKLLPSELFSYNLYRGSQEVVSNGHYCSLLEVTDKSRFSTNVPKLLQELEIKRVVLVTPLTGRGFLFLLSSVQMATPTERGESWKRCLQALFVFPESRDVARAALRCASSSHDTSETSMSGATVMTRLSHFIPALHHALVKARANSPPELSVGVERQAREYLIDLNDGKAQQYPMGKYESTLDEQGKLFPAPSHHRVNMDGYLRSYLYSPTFYQLSVARAKLMMEAHCGPGEPQEARLRKNCGGRRDVTGKEATRNTGDRRSNTQKMQQLVDLVLTCKRNAENEVNREERGGGGGVKEPGRKRRLEQETAERTIKFLKASQEPGSHSKIPVGGSQVSASPDSLASVIGSVGLKDVDLREDGSELAAQLLSLLTGLSQAARGTSDPRLREAPDEGQTESCPFGQLASKLGLPTNCDIDLRKQEELEEQTAGSVSSLEGFSPSSHSGEMNHYAGRGGGLGRRAGGYEEEEDEGEIPWVLIPITGLSSERYTHRDRNIPQDPRFQHLTTPTSITTATKPQRKSPTPSPEPSPPPSPFLCPSPEPSPPPSHSQCPSPEPSPPPSPSQCPSPEPSPPPSPSQCPSPEPSPSPSPSQCPSPQPSLPSSPSQCLSPHLSHFHSPPRPPSPEPKKLSSFNEEHSGANEEQSAVAASRDFAGDLSHRESKDKKEKLQGKEKKNEEASVSTSIQPSVPPATESRTNPSPPPTERGMDDTEGKDGKVKMVQAEPLGKEKETPPVENMQKREEEASTSKPKEELMKVKHVVAGDKELGSGPCVSSPHSLRNIDSIVNKHLGDFSSEMQLILQEENVHCSFPQLPHSTSNKDAAAYSHTPPHTLISQFSQYVSFYNHCPPVQNYVSSLQDSIDSMLTELDDSWPMRREPDTSRTNTDATLASKVSAFVSSIRAANVVNDGLFGDLTADLCASVSQTPTPGAGDEMWQPHTITRQFPDVTNRNSPNSDVTLSLATSAFSSVYNPNNTSVLHPPPSMSPQSHWTPQPSHTVEIKRTVPPNIGQIEDDGITTTVRCTAAVEGVSSFAGTNSEVTLPGFSGVSKPLMEPTHPSERLSSPASVSVPGPGSGPAPQATDLSSLISQLKPEVFNNLVEIIKDVKRNSVQFYLHATEQKDQVYEDVKEHLLKQGNVEQSPVTFLNQDNSDSRLLVIIKNKDISGHVHKIPGLVSLKRHPSVVFLGIDTLDDIRNNSYNELFVSGGCIVSDEFVLSPDFITDDRLAALLMLLEQHSSPESVWRWKVHCKTHKKLKEQARFRRDAANLLDILSAYQKRQIVEFLPYHHCDMMNHQSPDLDCLMELQARYTQYRHTVLLTEQHLEKFMAYSRVGIIVASIEEFLRDFTRLVDYHGNQRNNQPIVNDMQAPTEHIHLLPSCDQPQYLVQQSSSSLPSLSHLSDQLVPDASYKDSVPYHSGKDLEDLRLAISQLRAERQAQLQLQLQQQQQRLESQAEPIAPLKSFLPDSVLIGSHCTTPPLGQASPTESVQLTPGKKAVAATLDLIHSALQSELSEEERMEVQLKGQRSGGGGGEPGDKRAGTPVRVSGLLEGNLAPSNSDCSTLLSNQYTAAITGSSKQPDSTNDRREKADLPAFPETRKHDAASSTSTACPAEGDRLRDTQVWQDQPISGTVGTVSGTTVTGSTTMATDQKDNPDPAGLHLQQIQQPPPHLQQLKNQQQLQQSLSHLQQPPHGLLQPPHIPRTPIQPFSRSPLLGPLTVLGGGLLGPTPVWPGGLGPAGTAALVWGFQQTGRDFTGSTLLGGYHNPAGQGSSRYRGGQRGGGFNGM